MQERPVRVLLVEGEPGYARLLRGMLQGGDYQFEITHVEHLRAALDHLAAGESDVILLSLALPDARGPEVLRRVRAMAPDVPVVLLADRQDEALALAAVRKGAQDYLLKASLDGPWVARAVRHAVERQWAEVTLGTRVLQQAVVAELGQRALGGLDIPTLMGEVVMLVATTLGVEYSKILELQPGGRTFLLRAGVGWKEGLVGQAMVPAGGASQAGYTLLHGEPVVVEDLRTETRFTGPALLHEHGVVSGMSVVIRVGGEPFGVLGTHTGRHRVFSADDVYFLRAVANVLAGAIDRQRAEQALRESEARYRELVRASPVGIFRADTEGRCLYVNERWSEIAGLTAEEAEGAGWAAALHPDDRDRVLAEWQRATGGRLPFSAECRFRRSDGVTTWVLSQAAAETGPAGEVVGHVGTITDITERRRAEEATRALAEVGRDLAGMLDFAQAAERVVSRVLHLLGGRISTLYTVDGPSGSLVCKAVAGASAPERWIGQVVPSGDIIVDLAVAAGRPVWTTDLVSDGRIALPDWVRERMEEDGYRSGIGVPLVSRGRVLGALFLGDVAGRTFTEQDLRLLTAFSVVAALALERARLYEEVRDARDFLQSIAENSPDGIMTTDVHGRVTYVSPGALEMLGHSTAEGFGRYAAEFYQGGREEATTVMRRLAAEGRIRSYETSVRTRDGRLVEVSISLSLLRDPRGAIVGTLGIFKDMTDRKQLEENLRQSQKLEALGRLAGGIAHDFNNLMTVISGRSQLLLDRLPPEDPRRRDIELFKKTSERAAQLTRQLLAFSRKQVLQPKVLDLNAVVTGMESILRRLIGEDIELATALMPDLGRVRTDPGQLEQVVVNLAVNARDAMPAGGKLTLETANVDLDAEYGSRHAGVKPGPYVLLAVSDTGVGMDAATRARIFEPFFTTKEQGKGTGLGLATVYGIVKQSGGNVWVYSEPGRGTTFKIYLPRVEEAEVAPEPPPVAPGRGTETVLLVEDEDDVRSIGRQILEMHGYTVLEARHPGEALLIAERHAGPIHILVTDVVMPKMNGRELAERLAALRPETVVLYVSGYTDDTIVHHGVLDPGTAFLEKPFNPDELARKVREVLDRA